jgi:superfamily I DNA/RNA helicase
VLVDEVQAICGFRGAAVAGMLGLPARCSPPARVLVRTRNHRSRPPIVASSNAVIAPAAEGYAKTLTSPRPPGARAKLRSAKGQGWSAGVVDDAIPSELATGRADEIEEERRLLYVGMTRARYAGAVGAAGLPRHAAARVGRASRGGAALALHRRSGAGHARRGHRIA